MAAGDRNKNGKPTDIVRHFSPSPIGGSQTGAYCGTKNFGYATSITDDVSCLKCLAKLKKQERKL